MPQHHAGETLYSRLQKARMRCAMWAVLSLVVGCGLLVLPHYSYVAESVYFFVLGGVTAFSISLVAMVERLGHWHRHALALEAGSAANSDLMMRVAGDRVDQVTEQIQRE